MASAVVVGLLLVCLVMGDWGPSKVTVGGPSKVTDGGPSKVIVHDTLAASVAPQSVPGYTCMYST